MAGGTRWNLGCGCSSLGGPAAVMRQETPRACMAPAGRRACRGARGQEPIDERSPVVMAAAASVWNEGT
jgi:hypothetical protein